MCPWQKIIYVSNFLFSLYLGYIINVQLQWNLHHLVGHASYRQGITNLPYYNNKTKFGSGLLIFSLYYY